jgi:hypothetical protein
MKKIIALFTVVFCCATSLMAQPPAGGGQRMTPEERKAQMIERLKPLNLTQVQTDSVVAIYMDNSAMAAMRDPNMSQEDRQAAMKAFSEARTKRLEKAIGADLAKKVAEAMPQRGGGRPGGGGGGK